MKQYSYITNISKYTFYDTLVTEISFCYDEEGHTLGLTTSDCGDWGVPSNLVVHTKKVFPLPVRLKMKWLALSENKSYEIDESLDQVKAEALWEKHLQDFPEDPFTQYFLGIGPYGGVAIWLSSYNRSVLVQWLQAEEQPMIDKDEYEEKYEDDFPIADVRPFDESVFPPERLQSNMRQYRYRFVPLEEFFDGKQWRRYTDNDFFYEQITLNGVEVKRLDGTFDFTDADYLMQYHEAGKPIRITVRWRERRSSFIAHFWLDEDEITSVFDLFFNTYPEASADLLLRLDTRAKHFEIALTGKGLPIHILNNTQYIVAKNDGEFCVSENYNKEFGAWCWR